MKSLFVLCFWGLVFSQIIFVSNLESMLKIFKENIHNRYRSMGAIMNGLLAKVVAAEIAILFSKNRKKN